MSSVNFQFIQFLGQAVSFLFGFLGIGSKYLALNLAFSFPVYCVALGKNRLFNLLNHPALFHLAGTLHHRQGAKAYQQLSLQYPIGLYSTGTLSVSWWNLPANYFNHRAPENKGLAQRALVVLNRTAARKNSWRSCQFKSSNEIPECLSDKQEEEGLNNCRLWRSLPALPTALKCTVVFTSSSTQRNSFASSLSLCK